MSARFSTTSTSSPLSTMSFETSHARWQAVASRLRAADGQFVYAVKSTNVYCRPTCPARLARRANVDFYHTAADAEASGYRACKRCKPEIAGPEEDGQGEVVQRACDVLAKWARMNVALNGEGESVEPVAEKPKMGLKDLATEVGKTPRYLHKIFKDRMGVTPKQYAEQMSELYRPSTTTATPAYTETAITGSSTIPADAIPFDFNALDFDFNFDPKLALDQERIGAGRLSTDNVSTYPLTEASFSPGGFSSIPMTPTDCFNFDPPHSDLDQLIVHAGDLPALSPTALDGILSDAMGFDSKPVEQSLSHHVPDGLSQWVWEAEWSNAVIDSYQRTATVL